MDIVRNPVSVWEALKAPFASLGQFVEKQVEKIRLSRYGNLEKSVGQHFEKKPVQAKVDDSKTGDNSGLRNMLFAGSVSIAALGSAFALIIQAVAKVKLIHIFGVIFGGIAALFVPMMVLSMIRLYRRDIACVLEASGWAVNGRIRLTRALGKLLTFVPEFPEDAEKERTDLVKSYVKALRPGENKTLDRLLCVIFYLLWAILFFVISAHIVSDYLSR